MAGKSIATSAAEAAAKFMEKVPDALLLGDTEALKKGFTARSTVIASMPHSDPKDHVFKRKNGNYTLTMIADPDVGLPYGPMPRLILAWITTEAVKTKSRHLILGKSLSEFLAKLGIAREGRSIKSFKKQIARLLKVSINAEYTTHEQSSGVNMHVAKAYDLWWSTSKADPEQLGLAASTIILDEEFFKEVTKNPVVFYMDALKALKGSAMTIDIYLWLTYKNSYAKHITSIPWESLQAQFGADYARDAKGKADFKRKFLLALKKVAAVYPEARKIKAVGDGLLFVPGLPHVPKTKLNPKKP